jgi:hypothetical protein
VTLMAPLELAATLPHDASILWSRNLISFVLAFWKDKKIEVDLDDEIMKGALVIHQGVVVHSQIREALATAGVSGAQQIAGAS